MTMTGNKGGKYKLKKMVFSEDDEEAGSYPAFLFIIDIFNERHKLFIAF